MYFIQTRKHLAFNDWNDLTQNGFETLEDTAVRYWQERKFNPVGTDLRVVYRLGNGEDKEVSRHKLLDLR